MSATSQQEHKPIRQLIVIGLGLIGGSLAKAARQRAVCEKVLGIAQSEEVCQRALELGIVDAATTQLNDYIPSMAAGDVLFIAVPTLAVKQVLAQVAQSVPPSVTVTDGASVKGSVLADVKEAYGGIPPQIVLGHPIAGSERSGVEAANPELYDKHRIILTPTPETGAEHLQRVTDLWQAVGGEVLHLGIEDHDEILAATSHLPHAIAFSLVDTLAHDSKNENIFRYAAGGFRDFTRIASSDAIMWRDIMLANKEAVIKSIDLFSANLKRLRSAVEEQDGRELLGVFTRAKAARDHFSAMLERRAYIAQDQLAGLDLRVSHTPQIAGTLELPGDKSITLRAIILAALAQGCSTLRGFTEGEDAFASVQAFRDMGVVIEGPNDGEIRVNGVGLFGLQAPVGAIYVGNADTTLRLLCGLLAAQRFDSELTTGSLLSQVSLEAVLEPLQRLGAAFDVAEECSPPVSVKGGRELSAIDYEMPFASAQVKSSMLLAALYAEGTTRIKEPSATRDHSELLLRAFGADIRKHDGWISLAGRSELQACDIDIPGDFSSAFMLIAAAALTPSPNLHLQNVGLNPTRTAALELLKAFGVDFDIVLNDKALGETAGTLSITKTAELHSQDITGDMLLAAVDELPVLMVLASQAEGQSRFQGVNAVEVNQKRRFQRTLKALQGLGVECHIQQDNLVVIGGQIRGGIVDASNDHRLALAFCLLGMRSEKPLTVTNCATLEAAFPHFFQIANKIGISIETIDH